MTTIPMDSNRQRVYQCILDLHNARRPVSRVLLHQRLNMKLSVVDEAVKRLKEDGLVRTIVSGILEPVEQFPPDRAISTTVLPDGRYKVEAEDEMMTLTPHEAGVLGKMLQGAAMENSYWYEERQMGALVVQLQAEVRALRGKLHQLNHRIAGQRAQSAQPDLFTDPEKTPRRRPVATN